MKKVKVIFCVICFFALNGCKRYYMSNMLGEDIDITYLVVKKNYKPVYCNEYISELINPDPVTISARQLDSIHKYTSIRLLESKMLFDSDSLLVALKGNLNYKYSYLIMYDPVDVFNVEFCLGNYRITEVIRIEKGLLILPDTSDEMRWKVSFCNK